MHYNGEEKVIARWKQSQAWSLGNKSGAGMFNSDAPFTPNLKLVFKKAVSFIKATY